MTADQIARLDREARGCASRDVYPAKRHAAKPEDAMVRLGTLLDHATLFPGLEEEALLELTGWLLQRQREGNLR
jgi:hypothetical protein